MKKMKKNVSFEVLLGRRASCLGQAALVGPSEEPALRLEEPSFWASAPVAVGAKRLREALVGSAELLGRRLDQHSWYSNKVSMPKN